MNPLSLRVECRFELEKLWFSRLNGQKGAKYQKINYFKVWKKIVSEKTVMVMCIPDSWFSKKIFYKRKTAFFPNFQFTFH